MRDTKKVRIRNDVKLNILIMGYIILSSSYGGTRVRSSVLILQIKNFVRFEF